MKTEEILKTLNLIFIDVFNDKNIKIDKNSSAENINEWDSLNHIYLVVEIEERFNLKFSAQEIQNWQTVKQIIKSISNKI